MAGEHGSWAGYRRDKCRCEECRAWNARTMAEYRVRLRERLPVRGYRDLTFPAAEPPRTLSERDRARFRAAESAFPDDERRT